MSFDMNVDSFFSRSFERCINNKMLYYSYCINQEEIFNYIHCINKIPIQEMVEYILDRSEVSITTRDIFQFSNFDDATVKACQALKKINNPGVNFCRMGQLLLDDGKTRRETAYIKYGENHAKTAESLGLMFSLCNTYFLSCVGHVMPATLDDARKKLMERLVLRSNLIMRILQLTKDGCINAREFLFMISESTYLRRKCNIRCVLNVISQSEEYDFASFIKNVKFE